MLPPFPAADLTRALTADAEPVLTDLRWAEGPVWVDRLGSLLVSDVKGNTIWRWHPERGASVFLRPAGYADDCPPGIEHGSNGLALDADDRLVLCDHGNRALYRLDEDRWLKKTLASRYKGRRLNSPNDVALHSTSRALYFTDPPYALDGEGDDPRRELDFCAIFRLDPETGHLDVATDALSRPNGLGFSPDGRTAYASNSDPDDPAWYRFAVDERGLFGPPELVYREPDADPDGGMPDGFVVSGDGHLAGAGPRGLYVFTPDGAVVGTRDFGRTVSNATLGEDGHTLFVTASDTVFRLRLR
jgi:gluconolactonase